MLKDKYCDEQGKLFPQIPSFRQFNYFYHKTAKRENLIISREGKGEFLRNHRVMLGDVRDFCPTIGYGMFDSTVCDIFLVNEKGELLGRPTLTACIDGYSSLCMGYSLGFDKGINSLKALIENIVADKQKHCKKFGIEIDSHVWNCSSLPHKFVTDKGKEYTSETFSQLAELGVEIINLPPYRPDKKSLVERFFGIIQASYKTELASKGVIFEDYQERGGIDYRKKATLTLKEFEKIVLLCMGLLEKYIEKDFSSTYLFLAEIGRDLCQEDRDKYIKRFILPYIIEKNKYGMRGRGLDYLLNEFIGSISVEQYLDILYHAVSRLKNNEPEEFFGINEDFNIITMRIVKAYYPNNIAKVLSQKINMHQLWITACGDMQLEYYNVSFDKYVSTIVDFNKKHLGNI